MGWGNVRRLGMKLEGTAVQKCDSVVLPPPPGGASVGWAGLGWLG